jgi:long-chain acyl-CoA synthetase
MAEVAPGRTAVVADDKAMSYAELVAEADRLGAALHRRGLADGSVVSTDIASGPYLFALVLAALKYGLGILPISARDLSDPRSGPLLAGLDVRLHIGDMRPDGLPSVDYPDLRTDTGAAADPAAREGFLVYLTSGTTGVPRTVARARPWYRHKGVAVLPKYGAGPDTGPHLMANPTFHLGTLGPALYALQAGAGVIVQSGWSVAGFVDLTDQHRVDSAFVAPDQLVDIASADTATRHRPKIIFHGGAACPPAVKRRAISLLGPILHEYYGTSETVATEISSTEWLRRPGSVGRPLPGIGLAIVDDAGHPLPAGELGEVRVTPRPVNRTSTSRSVRTGDLGHLDDDGYLYVVGRLTATGDHRLARLAHAISALPAVTDIAVIETDGRIMCLVESGETRDPTLQCTVEAMAAELELPARVVVARHGTFPRTPSGKIRHVDPLAGVGQP